MTTIFLCENPMQVSDALLTRYASRMDSYRYRKAKKYRFRKDWAMCIIAYMLLEKGIKELYGVIQMPMINWEKKPFFINYPEIHFNLSHCEQVVACAISNYKIGIDVQNDDPLLFDAGKHIFSKEEVYQLESIQNEKNRLLEYRKLWTQKEAYGKYLGVGLAYDTEKMEVDSDVSVYEKNMELYSLCAVGKWQENPVIIKELL